MSINNISVTIVCPGPVESDIHLHTVRKPGLEPLVCLSMFVYVFSHYVQDEGKKMPTARFAVLAEKAIYHKFDEVWISHQPYLFFTYVSTYSPWVSRQLLKYVGPLRVKALKTGRNIYSMQVCRLLEAET